MHKLFIGSSSEAKKRLIVPTIVKHLSDYFDTVPWYDTFEPGTFPLEFLLNTIDDYDLALLVFTKDDIRKMRGNKGAVTRDNVILEYGLFLSHLGRKNVCILQEEGSEEPSDLKGLTVLRFKTDEKDTLEKLTSRTKTEIELKLAELVSLWKKIPEKKTGSLMINDAGIGIAEVIQTSKNDINKIENRLGDLHNPRNSRPISFNAADLCISIYAEGLNKVKHRFWATTYFSSGFWINGDAKILNANKETLTRLSSGGDISRIFLLQQPITKEIEWWKKMLKIYRIQNRENELEQIIFEFENLKNSIKSLLDQGCKIKVVHDKFSHKKLPHEVDFTYGDSEIAIYDNFRLDVFGGGKSGAITNVDVFSEASKYFESIKARAEEYFIELWNKATPINEFLDFWETEFQSIQKEIDYIPNWIVKYENSLNSEDNLLKIVELQAVKDFLIKNNFWKNINRYLDIGTCTARYPVELRDFITEDGQILGIDNDEDCVGLSKQKSKDYPQITIRHLDFSKIDLSSIGKFDLITCMLGTISYFGCNKNEKYEDALQNLIFRMKAHLSEKGTLIISNWTEQAIKELKLIDIYTHSQKERLSQWTVNLSELKDRLTNAGFAVLEEKRINSRLCVLFCQNEDYR